MEKIRENYYSTYFTVWKCSGISLIYTPCKGQDRRIGFESKGQKFFDIKDSPDWLKFYINSIVLLYQNEENSVCGNEENLFREYIYIFIS